MSHFTNSTCVLPSILFIIILMSRIIGNKNKQSNMIEHDYIMEGNY
jgi:hypothetical protein